MKTMFANRTAKWIAVLGLWLLPIWRGAAQFVEIAAEIEVTGHRLDDTNAQAAKPRIISLVCIAGTNEWRVENNFATDVDQKWFYDGTNVYERLASTKNTTINIRSSRDGHPMGDAGVNIPWLAFCSGSYLKRQGRIVPLPADILHHTRDRFGYTDKTTTFADELGLPQTVDLYTSRSLLQASEDDFDREYFFGDRYTEWTRRMVANLPEGVLTFHYAVIESTNFLGRNYPTKFEFFQNGRKYEQNGDWFCGGIGRVKSVRATAKPEGLFKSGTQQTIVDWRFRDETARLDAIIYTSTNGFVSPTNDPALQEKFGVRVKESLHQDLSQKWNQLRRSHGILNPKKMAY